MRGGSCGISDTTRVLALVDQLYASILEDGGFPAALEAVAKYAEAKGVFYVRANRRTGAVLSSVGIGTDPAVQHQYDSYYGSIDVRIPPTLSIPLGAPITESICLERAAFEASEIYNDFLVPHDIPHIMAVWVAKTADVLAAVSLQRGRRQGPFNDRDWKRISPVAPHLIRATSIRELMQPIRQQHRAYCDVLDHLPFGIVLLDERGRVLEASAPARRVLQAPENGLCLRQGRIAAIRFADDRKLQCAIRSVASRRGKGVLGADTIGVQRIGRRPVIVSIVPFAEMSGPMSKTAACMLVVSDPDADVDLPVMSVMRALNLTRAEATLACSMLSGTTLTDAAVHLGRARNTCKSQLKAIYDKTGCRSHVELARLLLMTAMPGSS